jgi:hypothetical protein
VLKRVCGEGWLWKEEGDGLVKFAEERERVCLSDLELQTRRKRTVDECMYRDTGWRVKAMPCGA